MIDVLKQSALFLEQLIWLLRIAEKSFELYELEVVCFFVLAEVPRSTISIIASQISSSFGDYDDVYGF